jgi:hypothetical protein
MNQALSGERATLYEIAVGLSLRFWVYRRVDDEILGDLPDLAPLLWF